MRSLVCLLSAGTIGLAAIPAYGQNPGADGPDFEARAAAYHAFILGRTLDDAGDVDGAIEAYRRASELDPDASDIWVELATLHASRGQSEEALAAGAEALRRDDDNLEAHRIVGLIYAERVAARGGGTSEDTELALMHLRRARNPEAPGAFLYLRLGGLLLSTGEVDEAIEVLNEVLDFQPQFAEAIVLLAQALESKGEWEEAAAAYERAVLYSPRRARYRRQLAGVLLNAGEVERARDVLNDLVEVNPDDAAGWLSLSEVEFELTNYAAAEAAANRVIALEPDALRGPFMLSRVFAAERRYQDMVDILEPAITRAKEANVRPAQVANLLQRLAAAHERLGAQDAAVASLVEAVALAPGDLGVQAQLVQLYIDIERYDDAVGMIRRAQTARPDNLALMRLEAQTLRARGDEDDAVAVLERALERHQDDPMAYISLANGYSESERVDDAVRVLTDAETQFPENTLVVFQLGAIYEQGARYQDAELAFRRVLAQDPDDAPTLNYLGYMLAERGERLDESVELIQRALRIDPNNGSYLDSLGWAYYKQNRFELAEPPLRQAGDQFQTNSVVQDHLGDLMYQLERYDEAVDAWERALAGDQDGVDLSAIEDKLRDARRLAR